MTAATAGGWADPPPDVGHDWDPSATQSTTVLCGPSQQRGDFGSRLQTRGRPATYRTAVGGRGRAGRIGRDPSLVRLAVIREGSCEPETFVQHQVAGFKRPRGTGPGVVSSGSLRSTITSNTWDGRRSRWSSASGSSVDCALPAASGSSMPTGSAEPAGSAHRARVVPNSRSTGIWCQRSPSWTSAAWPRTGVFRRGSRIEPATPLIGARPCRTRAVWNGLFGRCRPCRGSASASGQFPVEPGGATLLRMELGHVTLRDGRRVDTCAGGDPEGPAVLLQHGMPRLAIDRGPTRTRRLTHVGFVCCR